MVIRKVSLGAESKSTGLLRRFFDVLDLDVECQRLPGERIIQVDDDRFFFDFLHAHRKRLPLRCFHPVTLIGRVLSENCVPSEPNKPNDATDNASEFLELLGPRWLS